MEKKSKRKKLMRYLINSQFIIGLILTFFNWAFFSLVISAGLIQLIEWSYK